MSRPLPIWRSLYHYASIKDVSCLNWYFEGQLKLIGDSMGVHFLWTNGVIVDKPLGKITTAGLVPPERPPPPRRR
jgi:hypothetical protein